MGFLNGTLRQLEVVAADALGVLGQEKDPLDAWDPAYIEETLPGIGAMTETYFRGEVDGLENIPADEPVLLVGNHSGGTLIADTFVFAHAFYSHFGPHRRFHQLAHDLVFKVPGIRGSLLRYGTVPANPDNMRRALDRGAALLVYPGGDHESYRPSWEGNQVDFDGRSGFVKLALELGVRIVPVVAIGGQETALFLGRGRRVARALKLDQTARLKVFPVQFAPPFGLTVLDLPLRVPLPAKIKVRVLEPIDLREELGAKPDVREGYRRVTGALQDSLDELAEERTLPVIG
jgi:1-acyl-sn-glycerol-3-phosphate acyltransferase